ncbi:MAG: class I SAM-dependent methyltransferase [Myxococcaceae bacterium]
MRGAEARLRAQLRRAAARRAPLLAAGRTTAYRLVNGLADGFANATVDVFGDVLVLALYSQDEPGPLLEALVAECAPRAVYLKRRPRVASRLLPEELRARAPSQPAYGPPVEALDVLEEGLVFRIRPAEGLAVGLYLDMRETRAFVRAHAAGTTLLNCFSYTGGFAVAALAGGAAAAANVDLSKRALAWAAENAALNGQRAEALPGDVFAWLRRLAKAGRTFSWLVLDPPAFARGPSGPFSVARDTPALVARAAPVVAQGGLLIACCNQHSLSAERFAALVQKGLAAAGRAGQRVARLGASPVDFPRAPGEPLGLKVEVLRLDGNALALQA